MSLDLDNGQRSIRLTSGELRQLWRLAALYGWQRPDQETLLPDEAQELACVLAQALPDIPRQDCGTRLTQSIEGNPNPLEWFSGSGRREVEDFMEFCREDGFSIS